MPKAMRNNVNVAMESENATQIDNMHVAVEKDRMVFLLPTEWPDEKYQKYVGKIFSKQPFTSYAKVFKETIFHWAIWVF